MISASEKIRTAPAANYTVKTGSSIAMAKKSLRFLKSVEDIPRTRKPRRNLYDEIIREFLYSGAKYAEVKDLGKKPLTIQSGLKNRLKRRKDNIQVLVRNQKVYLKRLDFLQQTRLLTGITRRTPQHPPNTKPSFDIMYLPNTTIVRARCSKCKALNAKDAKVCRDCGSDLYLSEQEYLDSLEEMETLERSLNRRR
jgi:CRISPR/Cas system CMR subunit Cmr6 (Cas7 group RAMP superfamily)